MTKKHEIKAIHIFESSTQAFERLNLDCFFFNNFCFNQAIFGKKKGFIWFSIQFATLNYTL